MKRILVILGLVFIMLQGQEIFEIDDASANEKTITLQCPIPIDMNIKSFGLGQRFVIGKRYIYYCHDQTYIMFFDTNGNFVRHIHRNSIPWTDKYLFFSITSPFNEDGFVATDYYGRGLLYDETGNLNSMATAIPPFVPLYNIKCRNKWLFGGAIRM